VVGGGVAGIQSALDLANTATSSIWWKNPRYWWCHGAGWIRRFRTNDWFPCVSFRQSWSKRAGTSTLKLLTMADVESLKGEEGHFKVDRAGTAAATFDMDKCIACGVCAEKLPTQGR